MVKSLVSSGELDDAFFKKMYARIRVYRDSKDEVNDYLVQNPKYMTNGGRDMVKPKPKTHRIVALYWSLALCAAFGVVFIIVVGLS